MKRFLVFIGFLLLFGGVEAQESTLTVMQYNLLQYGNYKSYGGCNENTNSTQVKDESIRTILDYVRPDIFTVCEFGATQQLQNDFLRHNLNISVNYWKSDQILNYSSNLINHIFYDSRKMEIKKHVVILTSPRVSDVYEFYLKTPSLQEGDTVKLVCIVTHPKAGQGEESARLDAMQKIMDHVSWNYANENVLVMGDFNMYRATEPGYQLLTKSYSNAQALFYDPMLDEGGVGQWNNNCQFARFHTQSTRTDGGCFSGGGLDDRFDFILMSDEISNGSKKISYIPGTYKAVGNDGLHCNKSINQNGNNAVPAYVAQALYDCSDHLPVTMDLKIQAHLGVGENTVAEGFKVYPNPTTGRLVVDVVEPTAYRIANVLGQTMMTGQVSREIDVSNLPGGCYFITVDGVTQRFIKQ